MLRWQAKVICGAIMFIAMPICFLLPVKMANVFTKWGAKGQYILDLLACFAGGVFLASYLVFMAPAVRVLVEEYIMVPNHIVYPLPDTIIGLGFFAMLMLDKLVKVISSAVKQNKSQAAEQQLEVVNHVGNDKLQLEDVKRENNCEKVNSKQFGDEGSSSSEEEDDNAFGITRSPNHATFSRASSRLDGGQPVLSRRQSIVEAAEEGLQSVTRSVVMMLALSIDSVLEGMTIGLKKTVIEVWAIFIGIIIHESVIAFCLGLQLYRNHKRLAPVLLASVIYTLMNPIGVILATSIYETSHSDSIELANGILQAVTAGCFIYIIFYEILEGQINQETPASKILATFIGYVFLASFAAIPGSSSYAFQRETDLLKVENNTHFNNTE